MRIPHRRGVADAPAGLRRSGFDHPAGPLRRSTPGMASSTLSDTNSRSERTTRGEPDPVQPERTALRQGAAATSVVVIGRNEGERLERCLRSLVGRAGEIIYVDSGSTDGSIAFAESLGVRVVSLDMSVPFTMARARNAGWRDLLERATDSPPAFVQFVDGDCEVDADWLDRGVATLGDQQDVVAVYGRRRERFPEASIYNRITDVEWDHPLGESAAFGGDVLIRLDAVRAVGGYNEAMIAGEEPEMCVRLRARGGRILRIDAEMTKHDAAITRFSQWWTRARRCGHAYAEGAALHGRGPTRHNVKPLLSALFWGLAVPASFAIALIASLAAGRWLVGGIIALAGAGAYRYLAARVRRSPLLREYDDATADAYARYTVIAKFAHVTGIATYAWNRMLRRRTGLMEYKAAPVERS